MSTFDVLIGILMILLMGLSYIVLFEEITLEPGNIPTIMNGLVSSISIIIGFTATILTLKIRREDLKSSRSEGLFFVFLIPMVLLFVTYLLLLMESNLQQALRCAMLNLIISFAIFTLTIHVLTR